jgi:aryl-alcohol dehydrogenase-like predicted oxidoreductase
MTNALPTPHPSPRTLGDVGVSPIGLGAMELSADGRPDRDQAFSTIRAAVESGITIIDTADSYGVGAFEGNHNEELVAAALRACGAAGAQVLVATKGGHTRPDGHWDVDGRPEYLRQACDRSLQALGTQQVDLYQHHRPDPRVPYEDSVGALRNLRDAGKVRLVGISNVDATHIEIATRVLGSAGLASVQNVFSPKAQDGRAVLDLCGFLGIAFLAYSPLGGVGGVRRLDAEHPGLAEIARRRGVSAQQIALAWELSLGSHVIPIPGCSRPATVRDCAEAMTVLLDAEELATVSADYTQQGTSNPVAASQASQQPLQPTAEDRE